MADVFEIPLDISEESEQNPIQNEEADIDFETSAPVHPDLDELLPSDNESGGSDDLDDFDLVIEAHGSEDDNSEMLKLPMANKFGDVNIEIDAAEGWKRIENGCSVGPFLGERMCLVVGDYSKPETFFNFLFEERMWDNITFETNTFAHQRKKKAQGNYSPSFYTCIHVRV